MSRVLSAGFVPLIDAAPLVAAVAKGFARDQGLTLELVRQASWASLRDHLNLGHIDCAQALAPLPVAAALGVGQVHADVTVPFVLSRGGNAITLSVELADEIRSANRGVHPAGARGWARALAIAIRERERPVTLAMVYPFSGHNFELRYWLASAGIHPDRDVRLIAIPPPLMVESLRAGQIDGFCVGAPWNSIAAIESVGEIVATKSEIFPHGIEKVLAMPDWLADDLSASAALMRALAEAAAWCDEPANHVELAELLARPEFVGTDPDISLRVLSGSLPMAGNVADPDYLYFSKHDAGRPRREDALWVYAQMARWGQLPASAEAEARAARVFRSDIYSRVFSIEENDQPFAISAYDRVTFDGGSVSAYLQMFDVATPFGARVHEL